VQKVLQQTRDECKAESGGEVQFAADTVRALDLTGAGHTDYIVDLRDAACRIGRLSIAAPAAATFTSWSRTRAAARASSSVSMCASTRSCQARTIRFALHGGYCGGQGNPSCVKTHRITGQPFKFVMPQ